MIAEPGGICGGTGMLAEGHLSRPEAGGPVSPHAPQSNFSFTTAASAGHRELLSHFCLALSNLEQSFSSKNV